jgi:hypothetical protein
MSVLLSIVPGLLLVVALTMGCYPGERVLARAVTRPGRARRAPARMRRDAPSPFLLVRGGALVATSLAGRAPPPSRADPD